MTPRLDLRKIGRLPPRRLDPCLRLAILAMAALAGLATVPTQGADATLARDRQPVTMLGADRWRLRPAQTNIVVPSVAQARAQAAVPIPEERRRVRVIYPAYSEYR